MRRPCVHVLFLHSYLTVECLGGAERLLCDATTINLMVSKLLQLFPSVKVSFIVSLMSLPQRLDEMAFLNQVRGGLWVNKVSLSEAAN